MKVTAVVGVDIGTSSSKGVLVSLSGEILANALREHVVSRPHPGHVEMDGQLWWQEFVGIVRELIGAHKDVTVLAVGVSGMGPCVLVTDDTGLPLRPAILYGIDTRASRQIDRLTEELGGADAIRARCGSALSSQAVGPKLAWLADEEPEVVERARRMFGPSNWLGWKLTDQYYLDHHSASQCTPLYDSINQRWFEPWARRVAPWLELPPLVWPADVIGTVHCGAAEETGLPEGIPVIAGTIDAWSEAVSVGAQGIGDLMLMYGTTMFLINTVPEPLTSQTLWGTVGVLPGSRNLAGGMATSGAITAWLREITQSESYEQLLTLAETSGPGARGLLMLPYFAGERTPIADPDARGTIVGLTLSHGRGDLYRAALEATAFGVRHNIETMEAAGGLIERIVAVGGGTQGRLWTQIVCDVLGRPQAIPAKTVGASFGCAFLAAMAVDAPVIDEWNPIVEVMQPQVGVKAQYDELYELYLDLYPATSGIAHALASYQRRYASTRE
jgi:xylulokinase